MLNGREPPLARPQLVITSPDTVPTSDSHAEQREEGVTHRMHSPYYYYDLNQKTFIGNRNPKTWGGTA